MMELMHEDAGETIRDHVAKRWQGKIKREEDEVCVWRVPTKTIVRNGAFGVWYDDDLNGSQGKNFEHLSDVGVWIE